MMKNVFVFICLISCIDVFCDEINIDYEYDITKNGLYLLDEYFNLTQIANESTYYCWRFNNIIIFHFHSGEKSLLYEMNTGFVIDVPVSYITSIQYISSSTLCITYKNYINAKWVEKSINVKIVDNTNLELNKKIDVDYLDYFFLGNAYRIDDDFQEYSENGDDVYILKMYDKFIKFDLSKIEQKSSYSNLEIYYIEDKKIFFISANNYGRLE